jgi:hypothetical protein
MVISIAKEEVTAAEQMWLTIVSKVGLTILEFPDKIISRDNNYRVFSKILPLYEWVPYSLLLIPTILPPTSN